MFPNLPIMVMKTVLRIELSKKPVSVKEVYSKIPFLLIYFNGYCKTVIRFAAINAWEI